MPLKTNTMLLLNYFILNTKKKKALYKKDKNKRNLSLNFKT